MAGVHSDREEPEGMCKRGTIILEGRRQWYSTGKHHETNTVHNIHQRALQDDLNKTTWLISDRLGNCRLMQKNTK